MLIVYGTCIQLPLELFLQIVAPVQTLAQGISRTFCLSTLQPRGRHEANVQGPASDSSWVANAHCFVGDAI